MQTVAFSNERIAELVTQGNPPHADKHVYNPTDEIEMLAFIGLFYIHGLHKQNFTHINRIYDDVKGLSVFGATMARNRFMILLRCLAFDDRTERDRRWQTDRLAAMRDVFEQFNDNYVASLICGDYLCIDECLYACRNQIGFRQYNPIKPARYGINIK